MNDKLLNLLARIFDMKAKDINLSLQQKDVSKWDSLTHMDLITSIEREFDIELQMEDILEMTSVQNIVVVLNKFQIATQ